MKILDCPYCKHGTHRPTHRLKKYSQLVTHLHRHHDWHVGRRTARCECCGQRFVQKSKRDSNPHAKLAFHLAQGCDSFRALQLVQILQTL